MMVSTGPPRLRARSLHGRSTECAALERLLDRAHPERILALAGEAGIGKTRLTDWATGAARARGLLVVSGCALLGVPEPLGVFCDAVRGARRGGIAPQGDDPLAHGFPERLLPELGARPAEPGDQGAMSESAIRYIGGLAEEAPMLLVLEDLHWADASSLTLVALLARTLPESVALLLTYRPKDDHAPPGLTGLRHDLMRLRVVELELAPLGSGEAGEMLAEVLDLRPSGDVASELIRLSGGNPLALEELARAAVDSGWIDMTTGDRAKATSVTVPWTLAESIRARANRLSESQRELLRWAAAIGEQFDVRLLSAVAGIDERPAIEGLVGCVDAGLLREDPSDPSGHRFAFRHALVHEALLQDRLVAERRRRHIAVLEAAEGLAARGVEVSPADLTRHAVAAGDRRRTVIHSQAAAWAAYEVGAVEETTAHLERALDRWAEEDGEPLRVHLLLECGRFRARLHPGDTRAVRLLDRARTSALGLGDDRSAAIALALLGDVHLTRGEVESARTELTQAVDELRAFPPLDGLVQALAALSWVLILHDDVEGGRRLANEGLELLPTASNAQEARTRAQLLTAKGRVDVFQYRGEQGRRVLEEAVQLATEYHDDLVAAEAHNILGWNLYSIGPDEAAARCGRAAELARRHGLTGLEARYVAHQAWAAAVAGRWGESERLSADALELTDVDAEDSWARSFVEAVRADRLLGLGELDESEALLRALLEDTWVRQSVVQRRDVLAGLATVALLNDKIDEALDAIHPSLDALLTGADTYHMLELNRWSMITATLAAAGRPAEARCVAHATRRSIGGSWADIAEAFASVEEQPPEAIAAIVDDACASLEAQGHRLDPAPIRVAASVLLRGRPGGRRAAGALLRTAHRQFASLESFAWCRRIEHDLRELGELLGRRTVRAPDDLTPRELEVIGLLAEGLTNRAIADRLVISEATAIRHVANIYAKLGATNRAAAVRIATERRLIGEDSPAPAT